MPRSDPHPAAPDADQRIDRDGWTVVDGLFTPQECSTIRAVCDGRRWPTIPDDLVTWIADPRWAAVVLPVLGPDVRFVREQVVTKPPHAEVEVPWHQDDGYSRVAGGQLTCFLALDDITLDNGCLWMASGSHRRGALDHVPAGYLKTVADPVEDPVVAVPLHEGSAAVFSSLTLHRSGANRTAGTRPAWMVQFCAADAADRATDRPIEGCPLVAVAGAWLDRPLR